MFWSCSEDLGVQLYYGNVRTDTSSKLEYKVIQITYLKEYYYHIFHEKQLLCVSIYQLFVGKIGLRKGKQGR